ncbi:MAG TPA: polysaccharide biosynthesis/export family protein [Terriglobia bacterium]|nr:polysaccharide biosynthesis/export family protein [Terriglobia bacterium]
MARIWFYLGIFITLMPAALLAQSAAPTKQVDLPAGFSSSKIQTTDKWNARLQELVHSAVSKSKDAPSPGDYRIGPNDLLNITVLDAPELSHPARVTADGDVSIPLLGTIKAAGLTPREFELVLQALLRRTYMKNPQVAVSVAEMQSHSLSVLGAVVKPGVFQIRGTKTLLEVLSMAGGLAPDAGDAVLVMRGASAEFVSNQGEQVQRVKAKDVALTDGEGETATSANNGNTIEISLKRLLDTGDPKYNVAVYPGDIVKVKTAGIVYVVGDVKQPGGFPIKANEHITVLQAIALGEGLAPTAAKSRATIIRVAENGNQIQLPVNLGKILEGKSPDLPLRPKDILFVPKSGAKSAGRAALDTLSRYVIWRGIP